MADPAATEQALTAIWTEVLRHRPIGVDDDFFALGGNSLLAVRMIGLVHERLGCTVPIQRLLQARTIAELARSMDPGAGLDPAAEEEGVI